MSLWRVFCHFVWSTKHRQPLLTPQVEAFAHDVMRSKAIQVEATVFALNGTENHVHLVVAVPRRFAIPEFIRQVKGVSSYRINQAKISPVRFRWQTEYGAFSFDEKRLPNYVRYVEQQKQHHAAQRLIPILERTDDSTPPTIHEAPVQYHAEDSDWWNEMMGLGGSGT